MEGSSGNNVRSLVGRSPCAMRIDSEVYYVIRDHLGSAMAATDDSGNVVGEIRYYASGETRLATGNMFTDRLFTGQREIAGLVTQASNQCSAISDKRSVY